MMAHGRPPAWFIVATAGLAAALLLMAVTETSLVGHYLIDQGEFIAIIGLVFCAAAGVALYRRGQLRASMPFVLPWLVYPVVTQGDQVIDNLSINWMRLLTHVLLALIFAAPVLVIAGGIRQLVTSATGRGWSDARAVRWIPGVRLMASGHGRQGVAMFAAFLFALEFVAAHLALGLLMVAVLIAMIGITLSWGSRDASTSAPAFSPLQGERRAAVWLAIGLVASAGLYIGYKNRPGAYQGSPSYILDPAQDAAGYPIDAIAVPSGPVTATMSEQLAPVLDAYARALDRLVDGYYIAERNYTYDFHNHLFLRSWPVLPNYRQVALSAIVQARETANSANPTGLLLDSQDPAGAWLREVEAYVTFNFQRAAVLERLSGAFEQTPAGLQHAAHLYEGEGKLVGLGLLEIERKHRTTLTNAAVAPVVASYLARTRATYARYSNRIVGF